MAGLSERVMKCIPETRQLEQVKSRMDLDKLDTFSEVTLGLCATLCATLAIWVVILPFFDIAGIAWIKSWEGIRVMPKGAPITLDEFVRRAHAANYSNMAEVFAHIDEDKDEHADFAEFVRGTRKFKPPLDVTEAEYAFKGFDRNDDKHLESMEFEHALLFPDFFANSTTTTTTTTPPTTTTMVATTSSAKLDQNGEANNVGFPDVEDGRSKTSTTEEGSTTTTETASATTVEETTTTTHTKTSLRKSTTTGRPTTTKLVVTEPPMTLSDFHKRKPKPQQVAAFVTQVSNIDMAQVSDKQIKDIKMILAMDLADAAGVAPAHVKDLLGNPESVSLAPGGSPNTMMVKALIYVPGAKTSDDVIEVVTSESSRQFIGEDLSNMPGIAKVTKGPIKASHIEMSARKQNSDAFLLIDVDHDGALDFKEFHQHTKDFNPPLTEEEAKYVFARLDKNLDDKLNVLEYEGNPAPVTQATV